MKRNGLFSRVIVLWLVTASLGYIVALFGGDDPLMTWSEYPCTFGEYRLGCVSGALLFSGFYVLFALPVLIIAFSSSNKLEGWLSYVIPAFIAFIAPSWSVTLFTLLVAQEFDGINYFDETYVISIYWMMILYVDLYVQKREKARKA